MDQTLRPPRNVLIAAVFVLVIAVASAALYWRASGAGGSSVVSLWPPFEMVYRLQRFDADGRPDFDQTLRLTVESEWDWRQEVVADAIFPARAGSWAQFKDGTYSTFDAELQVTRQLPVEEGIVSPGAIDPTALPAIRNHRHRPGWTLDFRPGERIAALQAVSSPCPAGPARQCAEATSIEWAPDSVGDKYKGGLIVSYERRTDGRVVELVRVDTLSIKGNAAPVVTPTAPGQPTR